MTPSLYQATLEITVIALAVACFIAGIIIVQQHNARIREHKARISDHKARIKDRENAANTLYNFTLAADKKCRKSEFDANNYYADLERERKRCESLLDELDRARLLIAAKDEAIKKSVADATANAQK